MSYKLLFLVNFYNKNIQFLDIAVSEFMRVINLFSADHITIQQC